MLRRPEHPLHDEIPALEDDVALFEPSPEWLVPGLRSSGREDDLDDDDALGFRSLLEEPDVVSKAWRSTERTLFRDRGRRSRRRRFEPSRRY